MNCQKILERLFIQYVSQVSERKAQKKQIQLMKELEWKLEAGKFPADPKKYVYNYSSVGLNNVQLEVHSLVL
ncbi:unnamed protein product [Trichobilharzia regenti]|nr:unnamed protein product [Trichobilharzia regenti]